MSPSLRWLRSSQVGRCNMRQEGDCLSGGEIWRTPVFCRVFAELTDVKIRMISQGASRSNLTCD